jgi:hypothetical protein
MTPDLKSGIDESNFSEISGDSDSIFDFKINPELVEGPTKLKVNSGFKM